MEVLSILLIALALALDAFAVAVATGVTLRCVTLRHTFRLAWHFGLFQAGMYIIGWLAGLTFQPFIEQFDHWLAFGLLVFVGLRMIIEAIKGHDKDKACDPTRGKTMIILAVATSIDALAVGLSFAIIEIDIWLPALIIGIVASILTAIGINLGKMVGSASKIGTGAEIIGGLVLVGIGTNILSVHGVF